MKSTKTKIGSLKYQKIDQHLAQVNKEKKEKKKITKIRNEKGTLQLTLWEKIIRKYCEQLYTNTIRYPR